MKIAITATGASLEAQVDPRFGRCPYFLIIDTDTMNFEAIENPNLALGGGAGIQSGQLMAEKDIQFVLTGNCGPNAHRALSAAGIQIVVGCSGVVREVVEQFKAGGLNAAGAPNVASHFGMAGAPNVPQDQPSEPQQAPMPGGGAAGMGGGMGMGGGGGRGMGGGGGRGMGMGGGGGRGMGGGGGRGMGMGGGGGRGMGMGGGGMGMGAGVAGPVGPQAPQPNLTKQEELALLRQQAEAMTAQMQQLQERIRQLDEDGK